MTVINDVLDYSQFSSGQITPHIERFALQETVQAAFELFEPKVKSTRLRYLCEVAPGVPEWVETDKHRLMQVLVNLLGNAIKFTHHGQVLLRVAVCAEGLEFSVQDTGIGIAPAQQKQIFERFGQADASIQARFGGSGLGLTISRQLVHILGGHLQLESQEGVGTRFWFRLPLQAVAAPLAATPAWWVGPAAAQKALRFLVVDDHPVNRLLVRLLLQRQWPHAQVVDVEDGALALQALAIAPGFDVVLLDMVMPVMDGIETVRAIRASADARIRQTPLLGLTANVSSVDLARFEQAGLDALLLKPFEVARLGVAYVPEGRGVFTNLNVRENLVMAARPGRDGRNDWTLDRVLTTFPRLSERLQNLGSQLSGGEQQMLSIGRALMTHPDLIILDEATEGLAPLIVAEIWRVIGDIRSSGIATLIVDRDYRKVLVHADAAMVLQKGQVVMQGSAAELVANPLLASYLGV
jgi:branched-chain amino acid transport system ATP-binding protein